MAVKKTTKGPAEAVRLYKAVARYVEKRGGAVLVAGGIQIIQWPGTRPGNFTLAVSCTGRVPLFAAERTSPKEE